MTQVNSSLSNFYQLSGQLSGQSGASNLTPAQILAQALSSAGGSAGQDASNAFLLDLSPSAQQLLTGGHTGTTSSANGSASFTLTATQKTTIENILEKYKNAPVTQATFDQIQNDLQTAGVGPSQLAISDQVNSFNPTSILLGALSGNYADLAATGPAATAATEQGKENKYMQSIISAWQALSTATSSASGSAAGSGTSATTATSVTA